MDELAKKFKKMTTVQLLSKVDKSSEEEKVVIISILKNRNQDVSKWEVKETPKNNQIEFIKKTDLISKVDQFLDFLASKGLSKEYDEVVTILGGNSDSVIEDLYRNVTAEKLTEALGVKYTVITPSITPVKETEIKKENKKKTEAPVKNVGEQKEEVQEFADGTEVKFVLKGIEFPCTVKKFVWDKSDKCYYYIVTLKGGTISYKRPNKLFL